MYLENPSTRYKRLEEVSYCYRNGAVWFVWCSDNIPPSIQGLQGSKLETFIFIHFNFITFLYIFIIQFMHYTIHCTTYWKWTNINENKWKCMKWQFQVWWPGLLTPNLHYCEFYTFSIFIHQWMIKHSSIFIPFHFCKCPS